MWSCRFSRSIAAALFALPLLAHDPITTKVTWSREISRVVFAHCISCHHEGGSAFSLMTYEEARPWAKAIKEEVLSRRMPPWNAVKGFGEFRDDQGLSQETLELVADWVEGGAPEGDPKLLPQVRKFDPQSRSVTVASGPELIVDGRLRLAHDVMITGIRAKTLLEGSSVQVLAQQPDGQVDPLLWLYDYQPKYDRTYLYQQTLRLPAGTLIEMSPVGAGTIALIRARTTVTAVRKLAP